MLNDYLVDTKQDEILKGLPGRNSPNTGSHRTQNKDSDHSRTSKKGE